MDPPSWHAKDGNTTLGLTKLTPLNDRNRIALNLTSLGSEATIYNEGYWGISIREGLRYHLKLYLQVGIHAFLSAQLIGHPRCCRRV